MEFWTSTNTKDVREAMEITHNFTVEKQHLFTESNMIVPDRMAVVNANTGDYLGTVGIGWEPIQPEVLYDLAKHLIEATDGHINGVLNMLNGSVIGISFNIANREYVDGDKTELNFLMLTSFNGLYGLSGSAPTNRIVCLNQANTSNRVYNLRHTKFVMNRIGVVKNMLKYYRNEIKNFDKKMFQLVRYRMTDELAIEWFRGLLPTPHSQRAEVMIENQVGIFIHCLQNGRGTDINGVRGTAYGAFQALTEYVNHERSTRIHNERKEEEVRFQSVHFGTGSALTHKGMNHLSLNFLEFTEDEFTL
jgi:phage/plasmid-like protein (TIGR03299 family)